MAIEKVSLSLDAGLLAQARKAAGPRGLSALVNDGLRIKLQHERLRALLDSLEKEFGPIPPAVLQQARKTWPGGGR
jgi:hypothetical protein